MPRRARFTIEDGNYHILSRGHNKQPIFHEESDYKKYLEFLLNYKIKFSLKIYHYVLMKNHVHLILKSLNGEKLSKSMRGINQGYAQYYRSKYGGIGYLWQDRFKSFVIQEGVYLLECGRYIELNPVRAGIVKEPNEYPWTSYRYYAFGERNTLLDMNPEYLGISEDSARRTKLYSDFVKDGLKERRSLERLLKEGAYGNKNFVECLKGKGLNQVWSHRGRPKGK